MPVDDSGDAATSSDRPADERVQFLRPLGYVESDPVVRRIGDRDLFVGNLSAADQGAHDRSFGFVLSVSSAARPLTTHHRPLTDGPGNDWTAFAAAVDTARTLYRREGSLLVHCKAGVSRSSTVLATALAAEERRPFHEALGLVQAARPAAVPHPALLESAVVYLASRSGSRGSSSASR
jgi:atypical dual specificity phosphatase